MKEVLFKDILKDILIDKNLNQNKFSKILGIHNSRVSEWFSGKTCPSYFYLVKICKIFDISGDVILGLK